MVFQYNPLDYYIEETDDGELLFSVCRLDSLSPKLRYNLHDAGRVIWFPAVERALADHGITPLSLADDHLDLPLLFHYGRSDATVAFYGANVTPLDVEEAVYRIESLQELVTSFELIPGEDAEANKTLVLAFELAEGREPPPDVERARSALHDALIAVNQDYREASRFMPAGHVPTAEFHPAGTGPFPGHDLRLKRAYIRRPKQ
jgi:phenylacetate-CoA ligase